VASEISVKHSAHSFAETEDDETRRKSIWNSLHAAFAKVNYAEDIPRAIDQLESGGVIHQQERKSN